METVLAVDLGGTKILVGEVTKSGEILHTHMIPSLITEMEAVVEQICQAIDEYIEKYPLEGNVVGLGVGLVGRVNFHEGIWYEIHPELVGPINLSEILTKRYKLPTYIGNDVFCGTLAELKFGVGKQTNHFIYMNIGTGIAARIVCNGQIITGNSYDAGEIGHMMINPNSDVKCICGRKGCVEVLASGQGMHNIAVNLLANYPNTKLRTFNNYEHISVSKLMILTGQKDELATFVIEQATSAIADTLMNLIRVVDPHTIVLGGGVINDDAFFNKIIDKMDAKVIRFLFGGIVKTSLDVSKIALLGASQLCHLV
jgi:Transcriptional regulator/sugar kinase